MLLSFDVCIVYAISSMLSFEWRTVSVQPLMAMENFFHMHFILQKYKLTRLPIKIVDKDNIKRTNHHQRQSNIA